MVRSYLLAARLRTLPAAVAPVLVASSFALQEGSFIFPVFLIATVFALLVQIGTNFFNDYFDFVQGADTASRLGPTRAVASAKISPRQMRNAGAIVLLAAFCVGLGLVYYGGWILLIVGISSLICAVWYTAGRHSLAYLGLGDLFVLIFFGFVATLTTYYLHTGEIKPPVVWAAFSIGLLTNNLLVVNNYRDAPLDKMVGKKTLAVRFGRGFSARQLEYSCLISFCLPLLLCSVGFSWLVLLPLLLLPKQWKVISALPKAQTKEHFQWLLKQTAIILIFFAISLSAGIIFS